MKINRKYLSFKKAKEYIKKQNIRDYFEWMEYCKSGKKPENIPSKPNKVYKTEWLGLRDWLGTEITKEKKIFLTYKEAVEFIRKLNLKTSKNWRIYCKSGKKPENIPSNPDKIYKNKGWLCWTDWLISDNYNQFLPYEEAAKFVRNLKLKTVEEWNLYSISGDKPKNIPSAPNKVYKNKGWISLCYWLGTEFLPYEEAAKFVRNLNLRVGRREWSLYCKLNNKPENIPLSPNTVYKDKGWVSWSDWMSNIQTEFLPYEEAAKFVRNLNLKGKTEWSLYCKSNKKPQYIPSAPDGVYKNKGWISWSHFLGYSNKESMGERKIKEFLIYNNINYEYEKKFKTCKDINILRFDFYIESLNLCIEFDGKQHYEIDTRFYSDDIELKNSQRRDKIKTDWCKANGVNLLRIPYWNINNIENILKELFIRLQPNNTQL